MGTTPPEIVVLLPARSMYVVKPEGAVKLLVVQFPLEQDCEVSQTTSVGTLLLLVKAHCQTVPVGWQGDVNTDPTVQS